MAVQPSLDRARGEARADSDVDVAVLVRPEMPPEDYLAVSLRLARRLESALRERVDAVTVLNEAPLRLQYRVLRDGVTPPRRPSSPTSSIASPARPVTFTGWPVSLRTRSWATSTS